MTEETHLLLLRIEAIETRLKALEPPAEPLVWPPIDLGPIATEDQRYWNG